MDPATIDLTPELQLELQRIVDLIKGVLEGDQDKQIALLSEFQLQLNV